MTVEDQRGALAGEDGAKDKFPIGMRVLAVDDDPICLKVLETLLQKCQYHVTTTNQAVIALKMLRENRDKYDLVISDVNMPDMDGFKLLELVGLEMDLPVIMLSAHSDKKLVMKGITHGACDYLLKPVRIEELKNIWQHVIRRKKIDPKDQNKSSNQQSAGAGTGEGGQGVTSTGNSDQNGKANRKRKDQNEDEDEEAEEDGQENEESLTQKKPRVVWSVELHRKFVAAVNQLGLDKAVPKKILDLMNVEGLTRENVASHLQKYRLYLKRISNVATQQANMVAALGNKDPSYLRMGSLDGFGDFRSVSGPGRFSTSTISSYPTGGILNRLNSTAGLSMRGIASSGLIQSGHSHTVNNSFNSLGKLQPAVLPSNQSANLFQGVQSSLELNHLPQGKSTTHIGEFNHINDSMAFTAPTSFPDARVTLGSSSSCISSVSRANSQQPQSGGAFGNQSSLNVASLNPEPFDIGVHGSSNFLDHSRFGESWQGAVHLSKFASNSLPLNETLGHDPVSLNNLSGNLYSSSCHINSNPLSLSSSMTTSAPLEDTRVDMQCQAGLIVDVIQNNNYTSKQLWEEHRPDYNHNLSNSLSSANPLVSGNCGMGPFNQSLDLSNPYVVQHNGVEKSSLEQNKSQEGFIQNNYDSFDDIMGAMIKRDQNETLITDGELGFDAYTLGSCM